MLWRACYSPPRLYLATNFLRFGRIGRAYALHKRWSIFGIYAVAGCIVAAPSAKDTGDCALRGYFRSGRRVHCGRLLDAVLPLAPELLSAVPPAQSTGSV